MDRFKKSSEIRSRLEELSNLIYELTDELEISKLNENPSAEDWSEDIKNKTYLELAKQDLRCVHRNRSDLKNTSHSSTVLIAQCFEKCLCHLLMLKGEKFIPAHTHSQLLRHVKKVYPGLPESIGFVEASLCELWYQTNRYPQRSQRGYENYYLILNMIKICERLIDYTEIQDRNVVGIKFNYKEYEASRLIGDDEIGDLLTKESLDKIKKELKAKNKL